MGMAESTRTGSCCRLLTTRGLCTAVCAGWRAGFSGLWVGRCRWRSSVAELGVGVAKIDIADMAVLEAKEMLAMAPGVGSG